MCVQCAGCALQNHIERGWQLIRIKGKIMQILSLKTSSQASSFVGSFQHLDEWHRIKEQHKTATTINEHSNTHCIVRICQSYIHVLLCVRYTVIFAWNRLYWISPSYNLYAVLVCVYVCVCVHIFTFLRKFSLSVLLHKIQLTRPHCIYLAFLCM